MLTESNLTQMSLSSNPTNEQIEAQFLETKIKAQELRDRFGFEAYSGYQNIQTNERAIVPFFPIYNQINQYQAGIKKYTQYGMVFDVNTQVDTRSGGSAGAQALEFVDVTTTIKEFGIQVDLWKDFMGRVTKSQFDNLQDLKQRDSLQKKINQGAFVINMRKLYWNLVANAEKIKITESLTKKAQQQARDARRRRANSVADRAEVARFESLVHQRKGSLIRLKYEKEMILKSLRERFPSLNGKEIKLGAYNPDKTLGEILTCTAQINSEKNIPYNRTAYDEMIALMRKVQSRSNEIDEAYDDVDIQLDLKLREVGVASDNDNNAAVYEGGYQEALDDINNNNRSAMTAGIRVSFPFGEDRRETKTVKQAYTEKSLGASVNMIEAKIKASHQQIQKTVVLLAELMQEQKANSKQLAIRVKEMKKKYSQARIPEYALIQDEDSLLQSDLGVVDIQLLVVNTVLDYFSVFHDYPCTFNRMQR